MKPRDPEWAIGHLTAALIIGVEEVLVVLVRGETLVDDEDDGGDEDKGDEELAIINAEGLPSGRKRAGEDSGSTRQSTGATILSPLLPR